LIIRRLRRRFNGIKYGILARLIGLPWCREHQAANDET